MTRIYLDTSVISYLQQDDAPERTAATRQFWEELRNHEEIEVFLSDITILEIDECSEPKRSFLFSELNRIKFSYLTKNESSELLARKIIDRKILTQKSHDDCLHIATAILNSCDYIVSWNFKHLVNIKTINGVRRITEIEGFKPVGIVTPEFFFGDTDGGNK